MYILDGTDMTKLYVFNQRLCTDCLQCISTFFALPFLSNLVMRNLTTRGLPSVTS